MNEISMYFVSLSILSFALLQPSALAHSHALTHDHNDDPRNLVEFNLTRSFCGTHDPSTEAFNKANEVVEKWRQRLGRTSLRTENTGPLVVPLVFHVITTGDYGQLDASDITGQINVLNAAYAPEFEFTLIDTTYTENYIWFYQRSAEMDMKSALRQGGCETLNVYSTSGLGFLGFATFPYGCADSPVPDGAVINWDTLPGGPLTNFDGGDTLTHEVGHWLGLYHTFHGDTEGDGCSGRGDGVADTPQHKRNFSCTAGQNTCGSTNDLDPLSNFMNYTPDYCMQSFTLGQFERMIWHWKEYREVDVTLSPTPPPTQQEDTPSPTPPPTQKEDTPSPTPPPIQKEDISPPSTSPPVGCKNPKQIHFQAEIQTGACGNHIRFLLQKKKKKKKGKKKWKKVIKMDGSNDEGIMKVERCVAKKFCYRYKLNDLSSKNECVNQGDVVVTTTIDGVEDGSKRKEKSTTGMFGSGCGKKRT